MLKEQANMSASPAAIIELTDEELEGMRGGCHDDGGCWDSGSDCDDSRRSYDSDGRECWGGDSYSYSFRGFDRSCGDRW